MLNKLFIGGIHNMSVSYEYYKIFYYVAKYNSFNKAAAVLSNSQPNISRSITNLEAELNCKLFYRSHKGVILTDAGQELFKHVEAACKHFDMGEELVRAANEMKTGILTIGFSIDLTPSILQYILLPSISFFKEAHSGIEFKIITDTSASLISDIDEGLIDTAFITSNPKDKKEDKYLNKTVIHSYRDTIIAGKAYKELSENSISLKELINYPLISLWRDSETYKYYRNFLAEHGLEFNPTIQATSTWQILGYTKGNLGIACMHPHEAELAIKENIIYHINLKEKLPIRYIAMVDDSRKKKQIVEVFKNTLLDYLREHEEDIPFKLQE